MAGRLQVNAWTDETTFPPKKMSTQMKKLPKVVYGKFETYMASAETATKRAGDLIAKAHGVECVSIASLSEADLYAVCVHSHTHTLKDHWGRADQDLKVTHFDVLFNPRKLACATMADLGYAMIQARVDELKAKHGLSGSIPWGISTLSDLKALSQDCHAISVIFRASVTEIGGNVTDLVMSAHRRNDKVGQLNAVEYGSKSGVERLLTIPQRLYPIGKNDWKYAQESWAGFKVKSWSDPKDLNAQRVVEKAVECSLAGYENLNQEDVVNYIERLSVEEITQAIQEVLAHKADQAELVKLQAELKDAGWIVRSTHYGSISIIPVSVDKGGKERDAHPYELKESREALIALHKAICK
jgi:hypothetical protein